MKEDFLHYVWKFQKFKSANLYTVAGEKVCIVHPGQHNLNAGPDFLNAQLVIGDQHWAGNVELHLKSADWYAHNHQEDPAYNSVLLHVVWEHNREVYRTNGLRIPVLELKGVVLVSATAAYEQLVNSNPNFIACEKKLSKVEAFVIDSWLERLYLERLEMKTAEVFGGLDKNVNHWEAVFFQQLFKNFGLKVNGKSFESIAKSIPFAVVQKCRLNLHQLESLLLGQAGLLAPEKTDNYVQTLQRQYAFLVQKFQITRQPIIQPKYFRLRPTNFPTIRISQFAQLYTNNNHLFDSVISATTKQECYDIFNVKAATYWDTHYNFGTPSKDLEKRLSPAFIDLIILNTVIPLQYSFATMRGTDVSDQIIALASSVNAEQNKVINKFKTINLAPINALQSQGLLQMYTNYCAQKQCLNCSVGNAILKSK